MPRNVELKAKVVSLDSVLQAARRLGATDEGVDEQVDRYYTVSADGRERVKLRTSSRKPAELVTYRRPEDSTVRASEYAITPVRNAAAQACLVPPGQPIVVVRKKRHLLLLDNVRVHLDEVEELGTFVELEAVVGPAHDETDCHSQVHRIAAALGLREEDRLATSYSDLLLARQERAL
ncbi:MAG: class IV adenylate cyclase [Candidatus Wallbacteria bacterium]|nr:class IV adenylate cyclase [Candidatus Wallbacteria bacterium]